MKVPHDEPESWPERLPAFPKDALRFGLDGLLWIRVSTGIKKHSVYDLIDENARRVRRVVFERGGRLVGFGESSVYVARTNAEEVEILERFRLPW